MCGVLRCKVSRGGLVAVGCVNFGGSIDNLLNTFGTAGKGGSTIRMSVSEGSQVSEIADDMATRINVVFATKCRLLS
jgi:hypothetical protein